MCYDLFFSVTYNSVPVFQVKANSKLQLIQIRITSDERYRNLPVGTKREIIDATPILSIIS